MGGRGSGRKANRKKLAEIEAKKRAKLKARKPLTPRQSKFLAAYIRTRSLKQAALEAGYSDKHPSDSGRQVLTAIKEKAPEVMSRVGLTMETVIRKYLFPLLHASELKLAQHEGEFTDAVEVDALSIRLGATRTALEIHGAIGSGAIEAAMEESRRAGVDVFVIDIPRPGDGYESDEAPSPVEPKQLESSNGHKNGDNLPPKDKPLPEG